ncbi:MAG: hypothetical protein AAFV53_16300 [Myxococcota bacterium]
MSAPRSAWLGWLRERWLHQPLPMVVVHQPGTPEVVCAAPSMWMKAREWTLALRALGASPGDTVRYVGPPSADWIAALVAAIRIGGCFLPEEAAGDAGFILCSGQPPARRPPPHPEPAPRGIQCVDGFIDEAALLSLGQASGVTSGELLLCPTDWARREIFIAGPLAAMVCGAELLVGPLTPAKGWLAQTGSLPDRIIARPEVAARLFPNQGG